jgi:putative membrane protein
MTATAATDDAITLKVSAPKRIEELSTMMNWYDGTGWAGWIMMSLMMVAFWALVIVAVVVIFRGTGGGGDRDAAVHRDPIEILDERFARGEIDEPEYHVRRDALRGLAAPTTDRS